MGVFYSGSAKETMGIIVRNNYVHDIAPSSDKGIYVVYCDDTKDGVTAESNLIVNFEGAGFFVNGGWDNNFRHNVLINCDTTAVITAAGVSAGLDVKEDSRYRRFRYAYENHFDLYNAKYPHWEGKLEDLINRNTCKYNVIADNVVVNVDKGIKLNSWEESLRGEIYGNNTLEDGDSYYLKEIGFANIDSGAYTINAEEEVCVSNSDFTIKEDSVIFTDIPGFVAYDLSKIGLIGGTLEVPGPLGALGEVRAFRTIGVESLIAEQENWAASAGATPVIDGKTLSISSNLNECNVTSYTGKKFKNTVFSFNYKQEHNEGSNQWGGFSVQLHSKAMPWLTKCVLVCMKENLVEVQYWGSQYKMYEIPGDFLRVGEEQNITFGIYDYDKQNKQVKIVLTIDGEEVFSEVVTDGIVSDGTLSGLEGYFSAVASNGAKVTLGRNTADDFSYYESFYDLDAWTDGSGTLRGSISTEQAHSGLYSLKIDQATTSMKLPFEEPQKENVVKIWIYDTGVKDSSLRIHAGLDGSAAKWLGIGVDGGAFPDTYFYRNGNDTSPDVDTNIQRSIGWHEFKWDLTDGQTCKMYIDNQLVATVNGITTYTGFWIADFWASGISNLYFDDLTVGNPKIVENIKSITLLNAEEEAVTAVELFEGDSYQVNAVVDADPDIDVELEYVAAAAEVAEVNAEGCITAKDAGTTTITVQSKKNPEKKAELSVTVKEKTAAVTGVSLDKETVALETGATATLTATIAPAEASNKNIIWTSSDDNVATVADGVVTGVGAGEAVITATTADGSFTDTCTVTVTAVYEVLLSNGMETAEEQAKWSDPALAQSGGGIRGSFVTDKAHTGNTSLKVDQALTHTKFLFTEAQSRQVIKIWVYDTMSTARLFIGLDSTSKDDLGITVDGGEKYLYTVANADTATEVARSEGWHEFKYDLTDGQTCKMYIDDQLVATVDGITSYMGLRIKDFWSGDISGFYFDDLTIEKLK